MSWWSRLTNVFRSDRLADDLDEELRFHLEERTRELTAGGMTREAARSQAVRRFGNPVRWREQSLDIKLLTWLDSIRRDVRLGLRLLAKNAAVTGAAVLSLSLALGACVAAFSLVDALILKRLPVARPDRLVYLTVPSTSPERPYTETFNDPLFVQLRDGARGRADLFAMSTQVRRAAVFDAVGGEKEQVRTQYVSGDAFDRLGVLPARGRLLARQDDVRPGAHPVAVVSHAFWTRRFGADPAAVGRWFAVEDRQFEIVGVAEPRFAGIEPGRPTDVWLPYAMYNPRAFGNPTFGWFRILGRLGEDVSTEQAQSVLQAAFTGFNREYAPRMYPPNASPETVARFIDRRLVLRSAANGPSPLRREFERPLWILISIAALVLVIAGSNIASLFLARTAAREREMALRLSIGAGRARLVQQLLVESALVAAAACAGGLLFALFTAPTVVGMLAPSEDPVHLNLGLDWRMAGFGALLTVVAAAIFGLVPAVRASGVAPMTAMKTDSRSGSRARVMRPFVATQVAFSVVVLFVGGLLVASFARISSVNPGFAAADVLLVSVESVRRVEPAERRAELLQVLERLRQVPGVQAASAAEFNVLGRAWTYNVPVPGSAHETIEATMSPVLPGLLETMRIPAIAGRTFVPRDFDVAAPTAIVVNDTFARRYFGREPAVGRTFEGRFGMDNDHATRHEIVGVVADTKYDLRKEAAPTIYIPMPLRNTGTIHVRVAGDPGSIGSRLRADVGAGNVFRVTSIRQQKTVVDDTLLRERLLALLSGFFAIVGLVLAAVGLYGVLSYSVVQRTREIGIRVALGARRSGVVRTIVSDLWSTVIAGTIAGLAGGVYLSRFVRTLLFEVGALDVWSLAVPLGAFFITAALAAALPAIRAARVEPVVALRYE
jgi:predicted permease